MKLDTQPASNYPTTDLLELLNLSFEEYTVPIHFELTQFLTMLRKDTVDLSASSVLLADGQPSGVALIARRGWSSRLAAMGIVKGMRGKGNGNWFMEKLITDARERGDREMNLEVIEQNERAVKLYQKHGFEVVRRLISLTHQGTDTAAQSQLQEIDLREMGHMILQHGLPNLPWQISGETIALLTPPNRAYQKEGAYITISNPEAEQVVIWSLLVEPNARRQKKAVGILESVMAHHANRKWYVPAIFPEEMGPVFEEAGFQRETLAQWQMGLVL